MKKIILIAMILGSINLFGEEKLLIDKKVTGVNKETIEQREIETRKINLREAQIEGENIEISNNEIKNGKENIEIISDDDSIRKELATEVKKDNSFWKYIIGALGIVILGVAL